MTLSCDRTGLLHVRDDARIGVQGTDTRVPLLLIGSGIRAGQYLAPASPVDLAPTLAFLAGVTLPRAEGVCWSKACRGPVRTTPIRSTTDSLLEIPPKNPAAFE